MERPESMRKTKTMAVPAAALVAGAASVIGTGVNAYAQGKMNRKTRKWNEKMYGIQRQDALADWAMTNEYNSPQAQMARLKAAGLNPNLVYGSGADMPSATIRGTEAKGWNPQAPDYDIGGAVGKATDTMLAYQNLEIGKETVNNLKAQNTVYLQDAALKAAQIAATNANTESTTFNTSQARRLADISAEAAAANLRKTLIEGTTALDANERAKAMQAPNLQIAAEQILNMREQRAKSVQERQQIQQQIKNLRSDDSLKNLDLNLKEKGIQPGDNIFLRILGQFLDSMGVNKIKDLIPK